MAKFEFEYTEINGLLYPNFEIGGKAELDNLGKYGRLRLNYLHEQKPGMYREMLLTGKLAEHCTTIDKAAFELAERIRADFLKVHPMPEENTLERIQISTQSQMIADEMVIAELICV
ncbi:TnpV protein [Anaerocolumna sp.]|uniref:TnpV protein n=1 Tax=Anaerocolumna sp. TaxID=2041569 RepID=UPI0028AC9225|nr:TnpV protein [Anaerocolumna sp.]